MTPVEHHEPLPSAVKRLEGEVGPHAHHPLLHLPVFEQLKQRNVFCVAVLYLVVCWLILDPLHVVFHMLDVPIWANRLVVMLMAVGFAAVLIFAWVYEITPEGLKPTVEVPHERSIRKLTGRRLDRAIIAVLGVALAYFVADKFWISRHWASRPVASQPKETSASEGTSAAPTVPAAFVPPPHSVAVLPFINLSGDQEQEYFSDGLTEELLNSLARINELQVAARTSAFSFKGKDNDIGAIARKLNVGAILEGSVRRSAHTVRITAQLINGVTGFHVWSQTYDRDLGDVLKLQSEIATSVASALKVTLLADPAAKIEVGGTRNAAAFDAYLRASKVYFTDLTARGDQNAVTGYSEAIRVDPNYALAYASRSIAFDDFAGKFATGPAVRASYDKAELDARKAIALAPDLGLAHLALALVFEQLLDFRLTKEEYDRALGLDPGSARTLSDWGGFAVSMGHTDAGLSAQRRAVTLDPLNSNYYGNLGQSLRDARRDDEAMAVLRSGQRVDPDNGRLDTFIGLLEYFRGNFESARIACETSGEAENEPISLVCLAIAYDKLGRRGDAEASLAKLKAARGDAAPTLYVGIYAQWGNRTRALDWLEMAMRLHDPGLEDIKMSPLFDPLRNEPRFQAIERALKFPD